MIDNNGHDINGCTCLSDPIFKNEFKVPNLV